jgi:hypothetical protein
MPLEPTHVTYPSFHLRHMFFSCLCLAPRRPCLVLDAMGPVEFVFVFPGTTKLVMDLPDRYAMPV